MRECKRSPIKLATSDQRITYYRKGNTCGFIISEGGGYSLRKTERSQKIYLFKDRTKLLTKCIYIIHTVMLNLLLLRPTCNLQRINLPDTFNTGERQIGDRLGR